jgi:hypothetical protein
MRQTKSDIGPRDRGDRTDGQLIGSSEHFVEGGSSGNRKRHHGAHIASSVRCSCVSGNVCTSIVGQHMSGVGSRLCEHIFDMVNSTFSVSRTLSTFRSYVVHVRCVL